MSTLIKSAAVSARTASPLLVAPARPPRCQHRCSQRLALLSRWRAQTASVRSQLSLSASAVDAEPLRADVSVKLGVAASTDRLDLEDCDLKSLPHQAFELQDLEELSAAGNQLEALPPALAQLERLQRLGLAGNRLQSLPDELCALQHLQGLWVHGNMLQAIPAGIGHLSALHTLSLSSNQLAEVPCSITQLTSLQELALAGNRLRRLPPGLGALQQLKKLALNGNQLEALPEDGLHGCSLLQELMLMGNSLSCVGQELSGLQALEELSLADNQLEQLEPGALQGMASLRRLHLFGNKLEALPLQGLAALPQLQSLWLEGNPLKPAFVSQLLASLPSMPALRSLGLDTSQVQGVDPSLVETALASGVLRLGQTAPGSGPGYFKLQPASAPSHDRSSCSWQVHRAPVLIVAFGSAPGTPNWGGLLSRLASTPGEHQQQYDVLYVVDPGRGWYSGGGEGLAYWEVRLAQVTAQYSGVVMLGDSMGASACLLFCLHATAALAFCPQVDLATASIRPAEDLQWFATFKQRVLAATSNTGARVRVLTGTWPHDLAQANMLPRKPVARPPQGRRSPAQLRELQEQEPGVMVDVQPVGSHRLALALDKQGKLLQLVQHAVLKELGVQPPTVRLTNLL